LGLFYGLKLVEGPCVVREFTSAATTTYDAGEVVNVVTGSVAIGSAGYCAGVALKDAGGVTEMTPIIIITPEQIWSVCYNGTTALTQIGVDYLLTFTTGRSALPVQRPLRFARLSGLTLETGRRLMAVSALSSISRSVRLAAHWSRRSKGMREK
jgi:hypothetical protein